MRIIYFYQYFSTDRGSWGTRVHEFTREWVKQNHEVTVVSSIYSKSDIKASKFIEHQQFDGVNVTVINVLIDNKQPIMKRLYTFITYALISSWYALTSRYDLAIASSGPITVGLPGLIAKYVRRKKMVFEVRDLWPQGAIELGIIRNRLIQKMAYKFEKLCYRAADLILTLSPGMKEEVQAKAPLKKVVCVSNAANLELFGREIIPDFKDYPIAPKKYALYCGNIGKVNNVEWMYEAAVLLQHAKSELKIVFIGDGQLKENLQSKAQQNGITQLVFIPLMPKDQLVGFIRQSLISLVPLADTPVLNTSSPNKFFESLAAGVPVIQTTTGWMKNFIEDWQIGYTVDPNDPNSLSSLLLELEKNTDICVQMGLNARKLAEAEFDKNILADRMLNALMLS